MTLSRKSILDFKDAEVGRVFVKEMGGDVCVATLTAAEANRLTDHEGVPFNVHIAILGACDEDGERLFSAKDTEALSKKPAKVMTAIANAVLKHNGMLADSADEAKNGSSETDGEDSSSASPPTSGEPLPS